MYRVALVATVNIGEIYSGYTFSNKAGFEDDPRAVTSYGSWKSQYLMGLHTQTPTSILLNAEKGFESFGFEAEDQYISLSEDMENSDMYFFQHFLCQENWYREKSGKIFVKPSNRIGYVPLKTLLIHSVSYLKTHFLREAMIGDVLREDDILWVVVYPDESKFDVRFILLETFLNTGISRENIELLAESHAIQAFARYIEKPKKRENKRVPTESIIILNCTLTQICPNIAFHNYPKGITSAIGMSSIINDIDSILTKRLGCSLFSDVTDFHSRCDLYHYFDSSLREYSLNQFCSVRIPASCFQDLENHFTPSCNKGFKLIRGSLKIDKTVIHEVFQNALKPLMDHLKKEIIILNRETIRKVILVGDFSSYKMTKVVLQESFPQYEFIVPLDSEIAAPIGATIAGHEIRSEIYDSYIQYVPKMSIVGTWHIEPELLSTPSGLDNSLSGKPAATASMATTNVTDDNSNLSFLPDPIRPSKIAIKLQDLYESEYTESFAAIVKNECDYAKSEKCLLQILHEVYDECRTQAHAQINTITHAFHPSVRIDDIETTLPSDVVKPLLEYRRKNAVQYLPRLIKSFVETLPNRMNISNTQLSVCTSFIEKSMECCWLMCVTEPPMFLKFEWNKSEQIDLDELEIESGDGKYIINMRWPPLYLYENGPLMNKGVVNAK